MADSLLDIGTITPRFFLPFNWGSNPKCDLYITRILNSFPGTATLLKTLNTATPIKFKATITIYNKSDDLDLLTFIHTARGRNLKFWVPYQRQLFKLYSDVSTGASSLVMNANNFQLGYQGYERIYIRMANGDLLTRWVTSALSVDDDRMQIGLSTPLDRDLTATNHVEIGRFLLVRFDTDEFSMNVETDRVYDTTLSFVELVREYSEIT